MTPYQNSSGQSGIASYEIGDWHIDVKFKDGAIYRYTSKSVGQLNLNKMKNLAVSGSGLNSFINLNVKYNYSEKIR